MDMGFFGGRGSDENSLYLDCSNLVNILKIIVL
jgi:hypothetical protein